LDDALHADRRNKIQSVAGPDVTDQIGGSVHNSAMEGGDPNPGQNRAITGNAIPSSFTPEYGISTMKSSADAASADFKAAGAAINAKAAEAAAKQAAIDKEV